MLIDLLFNGIDNSPGFVTIVIAFEDSYEGTIGTLSPELLCKTVFIVSHNCVSSFKDNSSGTVILFETECRSVCKIGFKFEYIADACATPTVNRLVVVTHHCDISGTAAEHFH